MERALPSESETPLEVLVERRLTSPFEDRESALITRRYGEPGFFILLFTEIDVPIDLRWVNTILHAWYIGFRVFYFLTGYKIIHPFLLLCSFLVVPTEMGQVYFRAPLMSYLDLGQ